MSGWKRGPCARSREDEAIMPAVRASFVASARTYGARRIWRDVLEAGFSCRLHKIERLMRAQALRARPRIRLPPPPPPRPRRVFKKGEHVKIIAGQFASFAAIHTGMSAKQREIVLINMLGATRPVEVQRHLTAAQ